MATNTYVVLDEQILGSNVTTVEFTGLSTAYTDLEVMIDGGSTASGDINVQVGNGTIDTTSSYSNTYMYADGASATAGRGASGTSFTMGDLSNVDTGYTRLHIMNYSASTYKQFLCDAGISGWAVFSKVGLWRGSGAINRIKFSGLTFTAGTKFTIYGIASAGVPTGSKATGGQIFSDSTYMYHLFGNSGTFTPTQSISADVLVVAGGGGGGYDRAGGGGAGGLCYQTGRSLTATGYTVTVGAGGAGAASYASGSNGSNSVFDTITAIGGGGAGYLSANGSSGGSGGGGYGQTNYLGGAATQGNSGGATGLGFAGGAGTNAGFYGAGGGGGAGGVGQGGINAGNSSAGGAGGVGYTSALLNAMAAATSTGHLVSGNYYYAGGGGGNIDQTGIQRPAGLGGYGGGGNAGEMGNTPGYNGMAMTGGGGGGDANQSFIRGGTGGSGVVIIRYAK